MKITAVIPAAGCGKRLGGRKDKVFVPLGDRPVLFYTLRALENSKLIDEIILIVGSRYLGYVKNVFLPKFRFSKVKKVASGGRTRAISVSKGLSLLSQDTDLVLIHDGARPFIDKYIIEKTVMEAGKSGAAVSGVPVKFTVKRVRGKKIEETVERKNLWEIQTPQVFKKDVLLRCYKKSKEKKFSPTDDAQVLERYGYKVKVVEGKSSNIKITTPEDLMLAKAILKYQILNIKNKNHISKSKMF